MSSVVNQVQKKGYMGQWDIVKFQIAIYCHFNKINVSDSDLDCLTLLAINGESELTSFCNAACSEDNRDRDPETSMSKEIFSSPQSVRNCINKAENKKLIDKLGTSKKKIAVSKTMKVQTEGNILLDIKLLRKDGT